MAQQGALLKQTFISSLTVFSHMLEDPRFAQTFTPNAEILESFGLSEMLLGSDQSESILASDIYLKLFNFGRESVTKMSDLAPTDEIREILIKRESQTIWNALHIINSNNDIKVIQKSVQSLVKS